MHRSLAVASVLACAAAAGAQELGQAAPAVESQAFVNVAQAPVWKDLRGKIVLLEFWGTT